jgi:hypothetical protein
MDDRAVLTGTYWQTMDRLRAEGQLPNKSIIMDPLMTVIEDPTMSLWKCEDCGSQTSEGSVCSYCMLGRGSRNDPKAKASNPKDAIANGKLPLHLWPPIATAFGAMGLLHGMLKYGRSNWRASGVRSSVYRDAIHRHLDDWFEGNDKDEDDVDNLGAILANVAILLDARASGQLKDDRQFAGGFYREAKEALSAQITQLKEKHASKSPKHYTIQDNPPPPDGWNELGNTR